VKELLPFCAGLVVGGLLFAFPVPRRLRTILLPVACVSVGAWMSWVNGELHGSLWPVFVSFDAILVWAGAAVAVLLLSARARRRTV
jgi:hypothetical protein